MKTVAQVLGEERQRQSLEFACLLMKIDGDKYVFKNVSNFKRIGSGHYEFDHITDDELMHTEIHYGDVLYTEKFCGFVKLNDK